MSNYDHSIDEGMEQALRANAGAAWAAHAAWNFFGRVWFAGGQFHEQVRMHGSIIDEVSADSLRELMDTVNARWGRA